jgi:periplasmic protein TonB
MRFICLIALVSCLAAVPAGAHTRQADKGPVYKPGNGVTAPVAIRQVKPAYTAEAMKAKIQGIVRLECVVEADGSVGDVRVVKALDPGLDQEAVKALKQWRFKPGSKDGKAVRVLIELEMTFTLR